MAADKSTRCLSEHENLCTGIFQAGDLLGRSPGGGINQPQGGANPHKRTVQFQVRHADNSHFGRIFWSPCGFTFGPQRGGFYRQLGIFFKDSPTTNKDGVHAGT